MKAQLDRSVTLGTLVVAFFFLLISSATSEERSHNFGDTHTPLRVGIGIKSGELRLVVKNAHTKPISFMSHIQTHERHYDQMTLFVIDFDGAITRVGFSGARDASSPVFAVLKPGAVHTDTIDLLDWLARKDFGFEPRDGATYQMFWYYDAGHYRTMNKTGVPLIKGPATSRCITVSYETGKGFTEQSAK